MNTEEYLKRFQEIPYKIFYNNLKNDTFNHAYLLGGPKGSSLNKIATFIAKSLICETSTFACNHCQYCEKVDNNNYPDLLIFDAKEGNIKLIDIKEKIEGLFINTSSSKRKIKIYIINNIEYLDVKASNMILKFLEEPPLNTYAIFTTESESKILPTILSRLEIVRFTKVDKTYLINASKDKKGDDSSIYIYSYLFNNEDDIIENLNNKELLKIKNLVLEYINALKNKDLLRFFVETKIIKELKKEQDIYFFFDILLSFIQETILKVNNQPYVYKPFASYLETVEKYIPDLFKFTKTIIENEYEIGYNLNKNLILIHSLTNF